MRAVSIFTLGRLFGLIGSTPADRGACFDLRQIWSGRTAYHEKGPMSGSRDKIGYLDAKPKDRLHR